MEKRKIIAITVLVLSTILISFFLIARKIEIEKTEEFSKKEKECSCDSLYNMAIEIGIDNYRKDIILDRLWKKYPEIYNEMTTDLE